MFSALTQRLDDFCNPILVKELRQSVRSRYIVILLNLFLFVQLGMIGLYFMPETSLDDSASSLCSAISYLLLGSCIITIPFSTGNRLSKERSESELLFATTMSAFSVVWGKFLCGVVLSLLFFSASAPFFVVAYFMRGVDLQAVFWFLYRSFLVIQGANSLAILLGTFRTNPFMRTLFGIGLAYLAITGLFDMANASMLGYGNPVTWTGTVRYVGTSVGIFIFISGGFLLCATANLAPETSNRMTPLRVFQTAFFFVLILVWLYLLLSWFYTAVSVVDLISDIILMVELLMLLICAFSMVIGFCERTQLTRRTVCQIPRNKLLRLLVYPFFTGVYPALTWSFLGIAFIFMLDIFRITIMRTHSALLSPLGCWGGVLFFFTYVSVAFWIKCALDCWHQKRYASEITTRTGSAPPIVLPGRKLPGFCVWIIAVILVMAGCSVPIILAYLFSADCSKLLNNSESIVYLFNPFAYLDNYSGERHWAPYNAHFYLPFCCGFVCLAVWTVILLYRYGCFVFDNAKQPTEEQQKSLERLSVQGESDV